MNKLTIKDKLMGNCEYEFLLQNHIVPLQSNTTDHIVDLASSCG